MFDLISYYRFCIEFNSRIDDGHGITDFLEDKQPDLDLCFGSLCC